MRSIDCNYYSKFAVLFKNNFRDAPRWIMVVINREMINCWYKEVRSTKRPYFAETIFAKSFNGVSQRLKCNLMTPERLMNMKNILKRTYSHFMSYCDIFRTNKSTRNGKKRDLSARFGRIVEILANLQFLAVKISFCITHVTAFFVYHSLLREPM